MQYSDTTNNTGLLQDCEIRLFGGDFGAITGNTKRKQVFTNLLNRALDKITYILISSSNTWQWDDYNNTDFPEAETDLISGQGDYSLDVSHLTIREVQVKNEAGDWYKLKPIDERDLMISDNSISIEEYFETDGQPKYFDVVANSVILYPAPNYNWRNANEGSRGLLIKTERPHNYFDTSDTTLTPGFASIFHQAVSALACAEYATINSHENAKTLIALADRELENIADFQKSRQRNRANKLVAKYKSSR